MADDPFGFEDNEHEQDPFDTPAAEEENDNAFDAFGGEVGDGDETGVDALGDMAGTDQNVDLTDSSTGGMMMTEPSSGTGEVVADDTPMEVSGGTPSAVLDEEDAPLKEFERQWKATLEEKDAKMDAQRNEMKSTAKAELDQFYETKKTNLATKAKANREVEQEFINAINDALTAENPWERISTLIDVKGKKSSDEKGKKEATEDISRFRNILIQLKNTPLSEAK